MVFHKTSGFRIMIVCAAVIILSLLYCAKEPFEITYEQVDAHIKYLSSDELKGRDPFSEDIHLTVDYIAEQFKKAGLKEFGQFPGYKHDFGYTRRNRRNPDDPGTEYTLTNVIGYVEGTDPVLKDEFIMFSAHFDHMGIGRPVEGDSIYNGAEDNATGTTAVMALAEYFAKNGGNKRSIMFVGFTAEERGMIGSTQLVRDLPIDSVNLKAMVNFEMIGKPNDAGRAECFVTGWSRSDLGPILVASLGDDPFLLNKGPEMAEYLYTGSDNRPFGRAGFVAHTIGGVKSAGDEFYHRPNDHYETLDVNNMVTVIKGVIKASATLLSGEAAPKNIERER
ncbi:M28 family peptidase [candidate division KSB1 bacterium]